MKFKTNDMNYFDHCETPEEAKSHYKLLAKQLHPDMVSGNKEHFQDMEQQYREFLSASLVEKQKQYTNNADFVNYLKSFFIDNPELMRVMMKNIFKSDVIRGFIKKNATIIDAGIDIYNLLKQ